VQHQQHRLQVMVVQAAAEVDQLDTVPLQTQHQVMVYHPVTEVLPQAAQWAVDYQITVQVHLDGATVEQPLPRKLPQHLLMLHLQVAHQEDLRLMDQKVRWDTDQFLQHKQRQGRPQVMVRLADQVEVVHLTMGLHQVIQ